MSYRSSRGRPVKFSTFLNNVMRIRKSIVCRGGPLFLFAMVLVICVHQFSRAGESTAEQDRLAIIELIEDRLAAAYTISSEKETPDFGTLDQIYPNWHNGEPAEARRKWTFHGYRTYVVSYVVHSVFMDQPDMAKVEGKKRVISSRKTYFRLVQTETSESRFTITCRRNQAGSWEIMTETESEKWVEKE